MQIWGAERHLQHYRCLLIPSDGLKPSLDTHAVEICQVGANNHYIGVESCGAFVCAGRVAEGQPADGCTPLSHQEALEGSLIILKRGECMFAAKVRLSVHSAPPSAASSLLSRSGALQSSNILVKDLLSSATPPEMHYAQRPSQMGMHHNKDRREVTKLQMSSPHRC